VPRTLPRHRPGRSGPGEQQRARWEAGLRGSGRRSGCLRGGPSTTARLSQRCTLRSEGVVLGTRSGGEASPILISSRPPCPPFVWEGELRVYQEARGCRDSIKLGRPYQSPGLPPREGAAPNRENTPPASRTWGRPAAPNTAGLAPGYSIPEGGRQPAGAAEQRPPRRHTRTGSPGTSGAAP